MTPEIAILIPTLLRPEKLAPLIANIRQTTPLGFRIVFVVDPDDKPTWDALSDLAAPDVLALEHGGTYPSKINAAVKATSQPWMLLTADDVKFHQGWYEAAMALADDDVGVIGTNDLHNPAVGAGDYATQMLIARWYVDQLGTIDEPGKAFAEGYHHNGIDVEICETAMSRAMYAHAHDSVIEHLHFTWGMSEVDDTYRRGCLTDTDADEALLRERRKLWQPVVA